LDAQVFDGGERDEGIEAAERADGGQRAAIRLGGETAGGDACVGADAVDGEVVGVGALAVDGELAGVAARGGDGVGAGGEIDYVGDAAAVDGQPRGLRTRESGSGSGVTRVD